MNEGYSLLHFLNSGNREKLEIRCGDALELGQVDGRNLCGQCLMYCDGPEGVFCAADTSGDGETVCPFLEYDPLYYGQKARRKERRRTACGSR